MWYKNHLFFLGEKGGKMKNPIRKIVLNCLKESVKTRNSDWELYKKVCQKLGFDVNKITVAEMCENKEMPSFESVSRSRRRIQECGMYLATEKVQKGRKIQENNYREMYKPL